MSPVTVLIDQALESISSSCAALVPYVLPLQLVVGESTGPVPRGRINVLREQKMKTGK